jgi:hypothetical protein
MPIRPSYTILCCNPVDEVNQVHAMLDRVVKFKAEFGSDSYIKTVGKFASEETRCRFEALQYVGPVQRPAQHTERYFGVLEITGYLYSGHTDKAVEPGIVDMLLQEIADLCLDQMI